MAVSSPDCQGGVSVSVTQEISNDGQTFKCSTSDGVCMVKELGFCVYVLVLCSYIYSERQYQCLECMCMYVVWVGVTTCSGAADANIIYENLITLDSSSSITSRVRHTGTYIFL